MQSEWDPKKARRNLEEHGVSFEEAVRVFHNPLSAAFDDPDHSGTEPRLITIWYSTGNRLFFVSHSDRGETLRIISARIATAHERRRYKERTKSAHR